LVRKLTADLERKSQLSCERLLRRMRRLSAFVIAIVVGFTGAAASQPAGDPAEAAFHAAITRYLDLHNRLKSEVPTFKVTTDPAEIVRVSDTLAAALQRARRNARRGEIFTADVTKLITVRLREQLKDVDVNQLLLVINDEPTPNQRPSIHMRFPAAASMATTPTRLLDVLPPLPDALEYRFLGRALVLRDRDAALIVDYIADVLPRR
jgi:hypothetical protein